MSDLSSSLAVSDETDLRTSAALWKNSSLSVTLDRTFLIDALIDAYEESRNEEWDGPQSSPTTVDTYITAAEFVQALPSFVSDPNIDVSPQGRILIEWYSGPRNVLTISVGRSGELAYSSLRGRKKITGTDLFSGFVPHEIVQELRKIHS